MYFHVHGGFIHSINRYLPKLALSAFPFVKVISPYMACPTASTMFPCTMLMPALGLTTMPQSMTLQALTTLGTRYPVPPPAHGQHNCYDSNMQPPRGACQRMNSASLIFPGLVQEQPCNGLHHNRCFDRPVFRWPA